MLNMKNVKNAAIRAIMEGKKGQWENTTSINVTEFITKVELLNFI